MRELGIPTVSDRLIQQALLQVLQPLIDPTFSEHSHGFRPGRRAHDAVLQAQRHVQEGWRVVVDVDLEKFFDRVNHDVLMDRLAKRIDDKAVLRLIRRYLDAGIMDHGVVMERYEGTPQGGPLSPLLANVLLDEVDRELERRGHRFVRYADDCNVYVRSQRAGERVLEGLRQLYLRLHLKVNEAKTAVAGAYGRKFLGYCLWRSAGGEVKRAVAGKALDTFKRRIRQITRRTCGRNLSAVAGRTATISAGLESVFPAGANATGISRTGRMVAPPPTRLAAQALAPGTDDVSGIAGTGREPGTGCTSGGQRPPLVAQQPDGVEPDPAHCLLRPTWRTPALMTSTSRTARCGPACRVVWEGSDQR
jgi:group II intron reverse transcriptase/maturase